VSQRLFEGHERDGIGHQPETGAEGLAAGGMDRQILVDRIARRLQLVSREAGLLRGQGLVHIGLPLAVEHRAEIDRHLVPVAPEIPPERLACRFGNK
jgi:hypothetical protein